MNSFNDLHIESLNRESQEYCFTIDAVKRFGKKAQVIRVHAKGKTLQEALERATVARKGTILKIEHVDFKLNSEGTHTHYQFTEISF